MKENEDGPPELRGRTKEFALRVIRLYSALPRQVVTDVIGKQLLRSGTSVGANYRESCRARSDAEFVSKIGECLRELDESSYWLELLADSGLVQKERLSPLHDECCQLIAILTTICKKVKSKLEER